MMSEWMQKERSKKRETFWSLGMEERALAEWHSAGTALLVRIAEAPCRETARTAIRENISKRRGGKGSVKTWKGRKSQHQSEKRRQREGKEACVVFEDDGKLMQFFSVFCFVLLLCLSRCFLEQRTPPILLGPRSFVCLQ